MDPELAALLQQLEGGGEEEPPAAEESAPPAPAPAEEGDAELQALMQELEAGAAEPEPAAVPAAEEAPADEGLDPEVAALMQQLGGEPSTEPAPAPEPETPAPAAAVEEMDPELAALMQQLGGEPSAETAPPPEPESAAPAAETEETDSELAALMQQLGGETSAETPPEPEAPAPAPVLEETDSELAALMQQLGGEPPAETAPEPEAPPPAPAEEEMDSELAALMQQLEEPSAAPEPEPDPVRQQIEALGGLEGLDALGWPTFARSFADDLPRQLRLLQGRTRNRAVEKEVRTLVKQCGGYAAVASEGITPELGLNDQLQRLRAFRAARQRATALADPELLLMAAAYGAGLNSQKSDDARVELLLHVEDYDRWASDARNLDAAAGLDGRPFEQRRQVQLEQQLQFFGGEQTYRAHLATHPQDGDPRAPLAQKVSALRALRGYNWLGGDAAYTEKVGPNGAEPLPVRLEKLKAVVSAHE
jgi:hypothetical protein